MWPLVAHKVVACLLIMVAFTGMVFIFKEAYTQAVLLLIILPIYLLRFDVYLRLRYDAVVAQVPLMAVHHAGRVDSVDPALWTPPPLREGAQGWFPEWGKTWAWYVFISRGKYMPAMYGFIDAVNERVLKTVSVLCCRWGIPRYTL